MQDDNKENARSKRRRGGIDDSIELEFNVSGLTDLIKCKCDFAYGSLSIDNTVMKEVKFRPWFCVLLSRLHLLLSGVQ